MDTQDLYGRYQELQQYVGWTEEDARRVRSLGGALEPSLPALIDDFYEEINRHPNARKVITGGEQQIQRLKGTLLQWVRELLQGPYDAAYVARRWQAGWRHVEIGLDQVYTVVALSRLRRGLLRAHEEIAASNPHELVITRRSLNTLLDLDLAIIEDAYQTEFLARQQRAERLAAIGQVALAKERSEAAFRTLVEAAPCMTVILRPDLTVAYFSPFAEKLTGHFASEVVGTDFLSILILDGANRKKLGEDIQRIFDGLPMRGFENVIGCKDGSRCWVVWNADLLKDYQGAQAILAVGQDITKLKQAQEEALQATRLATIGQMTAGLAHESRNALQLIQANLEMLALEVEDRPEALQLIESIQGAEDRLHRLFEDVRGYAAPIQLERDVYDISGVWRGAWAQLGAARNGRNAVIREWTTGVDLHCYIDLYSVERVFRNLFENSLAAGRDPVEIDIRCAAIDLRGRPGLQIRVCDNGPGFTPAQRQRAFQPFFTTKRQGTGLGMAIARRVVEAHGGAITLGESPGPGAEIVIMLPRGTK
jgi:PAS domain S-box-containing protein